jgi:hypothetical protein
VRDSPLNRSSRGNFGLNAAASPADFGPSIRSELRSLTRAEKWWACAAISGSSFSNSPYWAITAEQPEAADTTASAPLAASAATLARANSRARAKIAMMIIERTTALRFGEPDDSITRRGQKPFAIDVGGLSEYLCDTAVMNGGRGPIDDSRVRRRWNERSLFPAQSWQ